jgi:hypothetical protein
MFLFRVVLLQSRIVTDEESSGNVKNVRIRNYFTTRKIMSSDEKKSFDGGITGDGGYQYFDKYRLDIDTIRVECERLVKENAEKRIKESLQLPTPPELVAIMPLRLRDAKDGKEDITWECLQKTYDEELKKKNTEWSNRYQELKYKWDEVQETFVRYLKHKQNYSTAAAPAAQTAGSSSSDVQHAITITIDQILAHSEILEGLSLSETMEHRNRMESQLSQEIQNLSTYQADLKNFLGEWEKYRISRVKIETLTKYRVEQLKIDEVTELNRIDEQYRTAKTYIRSLDKQKDRVIDVVCHYGSYNFSDIFKISIRDKVKTFVQKFLANCKYDKSNEIAQAVIVGGPKMLDNLYLKDYNVNIIDKIEIIICKLAPTAPPGLVGVAAPPGILGLLD